MYIFKRLPDKTICNLSMGLCYPQDQVHTCQHLSAAPPPPSPWFQQSHYTKTCSSLSKPQYLMDSHIFVQVATSKNNTHCQIVEHLLYDWLCGICWGHSGDRNRLSPSGVTWCMVILVVRQGTHKWPFVLFTWKTLSYQPQVLFTSSVYHFPILT